MKKLLIPFIALFFIGCEKDDPTSSEEIINNCLLTKADDGSWWNYYCIIWTGTKEECEASSENYYQGSSAQFFTNSTCEEICENASTPNGECEACMYDHDTPGTDVIDSFSSCYGN